MEVIFEKMCCGLICFKGVVLVDGKVVCEVMMMCVCSWEVWYVIDKFVFVYLIVIVEEGVLIGVNVYIGFFCIVGFYVEIGEGIVLKFYVVVNGYIKIGCDNEIY